MMRGEGGGRGRRLPVVLTADESERLVMAAGRRYPSNLRNRALLLVMLDAGLRLSECLHLEWRDLELLTGELKVRQGKGRKDRLVWLGERAVEALVAWRRRQVDEVSRRGGNLVHAPAFSTLAGGALGARYVQRMVERLAGRARIFYKRVSPHTLRHTFATDLYRRTRDLALVAKALGHSSITTTTIYTHLTDPELETAMRALRATPAQRNGGPDPEQGRQTPQIQRQ